MSRYLLDTHILLWWAEDNPRLSRSHRDLLEDGANIVHMSVVNVWEASIKAALGKLQLSREPMQFFQLVAERYQFTVLPVHLSHAAGVYSLPKVHSDPFDRLLISQARSEGLVLLSDDSVFEKYDLPGLVR